MCVVLLTILTIFIVLLSYIIEPHYSYSHYFELLHYNCSIKNVLTLQIFKLLILEYQQSKEAFANWFARTRSTVFKTAYKNTRYAIRIQNKVVGAISHKCLRHM